MERRFVTIIEWYSGNKTKHSLTYENLLYVISDAIQNGVVVNIEIKVQEREQYEIQSLYSDCQMGKANRKKV